MHYGILIVFSTLKAELDMATQQERRQKTRQKILNAASELFMKQGFEKTTISQILLRANIVKGTFYQHFETKMDLLVVLGRQEGAEQVQQLIETVRQGASALEALQRYYLVLAQWFEANAPIAQDVIISAIRLHNPESSSPEYVAHDFTRLILSLAQEQGEVRTDVDANTQAIAIGGAFTLAAVDWCHNPEASGLQQQTAACFKIFLDGVRVESNMK